jgi:TRAP-type uncharacterized transport system substrate-binding protein
MLPVVNARKIARFHLDQQAKSRSSVANVLELREGETETGLPEEASMAEAAEATEEVSTEETEVLMTQRDSLRW